MQPLGEVDSQLKDDECEPKARRLKAKNNNFLRIYHYASIRQFAFLIKEKGRTFTKQTAKILINSKLENVYFTFFYIVRVYKVSPENPILVVFTLEILHDAILKIST